MAPSTKRFPAAMTAEGYASSRSSFLIPSLDRELWFIDIRNGKRYDSAYLIYTGRSVTADDVLKKLTVAPSDLDCVRLVLNSFIEELAHFKIGNVVAIDSHEADRIRLQLVAKSTKSRQGPKIPG